MSFLFTDVVRSTSLLTTLERSRYASLLEAERAALEGAVVAYQGSVVDRAGDEILAAFPSAGDALAAAATAQRTGTLADELGMDAAKDLLDQTLDEESQADKLLTKIATGALFKAGINQRARN